jgi:transcription initiation factor TFIIIB Brf1 subunit/transcription initiation factor TFIIB
MMDPYKV